MKEEKCAKMILDVVSGKICLASTQGDNHELPFAWAEILPAGIRRRRDGPCVVLWGQQVRGDMGGRTPQPSGQRCHQGGSALLCASVDMCQVPRSHRKISPLPHFWARSGQPLCRHIQGSAVPRGVTQLSPRKTIPPFCLPSWLGRGWTGAAGRERRPAPLMTDARRCGVAWWGWDSP